MAWLSAAVRWPDALVESDYSPIHVVEKYRPQLPPALRALPAPILLALPVLLFFLTLTFLTAVFRPTPKGKVGVPAHLASGRKAQRKSGARTVLLLGPSDAGKTSIFSALVFGSVPKTHTSQHESEGHTILGPPGPLPGEQQVSPRSSVPVHLIDLPGHPRLRVRANDFLPVADALVFCVDATLAARAATSSTAQGAAAALSEAIEFFHATLTVLATQRLKSQSSKAPPALQILFTRSDLSPLLSSSGTASADAAQLAKRKAQLLQRAKAGFEAELSRRRQALQVGRRGAAPKIGGIGRVQGGDGGSSSAAGGILGRFRKLLGLPSTSSGSGEKGGFDDGEDEDEEEYDYVDWATIQRQQQEASSALLSISLDKLDEEVIEGGKAHFGLISLGRERDWLGGSGSTREGKDDRDLRSFLTSL